MSDWSVPKADWNYKTPEAMVMNIREGRYAVEIDGKWTFMWVNSPTRGKYKGYFLVRTQHSESYTLAYAKRLDTDTNYFYNTRPSFDHALMMVACDPFTSAINYGIELGCCSRCARELTDERSRWYSIGPECEQHWPEIINYINETKGEFQG